MHTPTTALPLTTPARPARITRWKACRLGAGALFGDRPEVGSNATTTGLTQPPGAATEPPGAGPALETAVTAEETELLEIGSTSYHRLLAAGVREREGRAVAVLRATGAMVRAIVMRAWICRCR